MFRARPLKLVFRRKCEDGWVLPGIAISLGGSPYRDEIRVENKHYIIAQYF